MASWNSVTWSAPRQAEARAGAGRRGLSPGSAGTLGLDVAAEVDDRVEHEVDQRHVARVDVAARHARVLGARHEAPPPPARIGAPRRRSAPRAAAGGAQHLLEPAVGGLQRKRASSSSSGAPTGGILEALPGDLAAISPDAADDQRVDQRAPVREAVEARPFRCWCGARRRRALTSSRASPSSSLAATSRRCRLRSSSARRPAVTESVTAPLRADAERNRQRLLVAAKELLATRGLDVTLDDVARHAGVGTGTAYRRFPNKDALIDALMVDRIGEIAADRQGVPRGSRPVGRPDELLRPRARAPGRRPRAQGGAVLRRPRPRAEQPGAARHRAGGDQARGARQGRGRGAQRHLTRATCR